MATQEQPVKRVMGVFAHPDDPEFFCGGTFARWAAEGAHITFVLATSGDKGSADPEMTTKSSRQFVRWKNATRRRRSA